MEVNIVDRGFVKQDDDKGHLLNIFKRNWTLVTWYTDDDGVWQAIVFDKAYSWRQYSVPHVWVLVKVPVAALKYKYHHSGFGGIAYKLQSPKFMIDHLTPKKSNSPDNNALSQDSQQTTSLSVEIAEKSNVKNKSKTGLSKSGNVKNKKSK